MDDLAAELRGRIDSAVVRLRALTEAEVTRDRGPGKWVKKEILGHLLDSAANNHQRFVRAQLVDSFVGPDYEQRTWVSLHQYRRRAWTELVDLWSALNRHLAYVIESVPPERLSTRCVIGADEPATLEWCMRDYVRHLDHHLAQILG